MAERDGGVRGTGRQPSRGDVVRPARRAAAPAAPRRAGEPGPGNQALQRMLRQREIQARLTVNPPDDEYEREADRVADRVLSSPAPGTDTAAASVAATPPSVSRVQRQEAAAEAAGVAPPEEEERKRRVEEMKAVEEEEKAAAREATEEPPAPETVAEAEQEAAAPEEKREEEPVVQTKRAPGPAPAPAVPAVTPQLESRLANPSGGRPLPGELRRFFEPRFGRDLSGVRLHTGSEAATAARDLSALAFTRGRHVYFAAGAFQPDTAAGRRLLAHELVHTEQQAPSPALAAPRPATPVADSAGGDAGPAPTAVAATAAAPVAATGPPAGPAGAAPVAALPLQRSAIQRNGTEPPAAAGSGGEGGEPGVDPSTLPLETGQLDETTETITFEEIQVPGFKLRDHRGALYGGRRLKQKKGYARGEPDQRGAWRTALADTVPATTEVLREKVRTARGGEDPPPGEPTVFKARTAQGAQRYFLGSLETVASELALPSWDQAGQGHSYDVDHVVELQLANWDVEGWPNTLENMELLDSSMNRSSGSTIKGAIDAKVQSFINVTDRAYGGSVATVKGKYHLEFQQAVPGGGDNPQPKTHFWTAAHLRAGEHLAPVEVGSIGELGGEGTVVVFPSAAGGQPKQFSTGSGLGAGERDWLKPYQITAKAFTTEAGQEASPELGSLTFVMPEGHDKYRPSGAGPTTLSVARVPGARFAGSIDKAAVRRALAGLRVKRLSPIQLHDVDVAPGGIRATGQILPDVPLLQGAGIDFELLGDDLTFSKAFTGPEIQAPRPFEVRESSLIVSAGTRGLAVDGRVDFAIERVGEGHLGARAGTSEGFALEGGFSFDSALFDPAEIEATYENGNLTASGRIGVPAGKVRGVKSASAEVTYDQEAGNLAASGNAELDLPGVSRGEMNVTYAEGQGLTIGGAFDLSGDVPGIRGGRVEAQLERPEGGEWKLAVSGTAQPAIPGIDSQLAISYDDGVFDMSVSAGYQRGMAAGTVEVGVTNRAVDEEGRPGGDAGDTLTPYGGGSVTLTLAPWLQATAGLRLLPDGSMEVQGEIGLPSALEIFPEKSYERNIFRIGIDIPIVGVAVAGQRIGIFATISGGLDLSAGVGPGTLSQLQVGITYNPEHEEDTRVTGGAELQVPAHAGLRLSVRGGLGAGIPIVSATAALEIGGALGLEGMARAGVQLDWTPGQGLVIDAEGEVYVEPALVFDVTGMVLVEADLLVSTIELYSKRWQLAGFSLGSGLRFGLRFPVHYEEGQPFDLDWNQVEFEVPEIDTDQVLAGLMAQIV